MYKSIMNDTQVTRILIPRAVWILRVSKSLLFVGLNGVRD